MWRLLLFTLFALGVGVGAVRRPQSASLRSNNDPEPESICQHCHCQHQTVVCNYAHNRTLSQIWNTNYLIPRNITAMELQLTEQTQFQLQDGIFTDNRVNRIVIKGAGGNDQVELTSYAFRGNQAGYPDIKILGVCSVFVRKHAFSDGESKLRVDNSDLLVLYPSAFFNMNGSYRFTNIRDLQIKKEAFYSKSFVNLKIEKSNIDRIESFVVSMNKIDFIDCKINIVQRNAFDVTKINELAFDNCNISRIEAQAFTSKLLSEHVSITDTKIGTIEGEAIMGSGISRLTLKHNTIGRINGDAIRVHSVYVFIEHNEIMHQGKNWLHVVDAGNEGELIARIEDNRFNNFAPIRLEQSRRSNCTFANNWVGNPQASSLNFTNCEVRAIHLDRHCGCDEDREWLQRLTDRDLSTELYCRLGQRLHACFNASSVHLRRYANEVCGNNRTQLQCQDSSTLIWYRDGYYSKEERDEQQRGWSITKIGLILLGSCVAFISIIIVGMLLWHYCQPKRRFSSTSSSSSSASAAAALERCSLSPSSREILQANAPRKLKKPIQKLISGKLTNRECEEIIIKILKDKMKLLPYEAKRVLDEHFQQAHSGAKCMSNVVTLPTAPSEPSVQENLYAELLTPNEYSAPLDPLDPYAMNDYSEPFNSASNVNDMPPAYEAMPQYATPLRQPLPPSRQQAAGGSAGVSGGAYAMRLIGQEVPDVLYRRHGQPSTRYTPTTSSVSYATPVWRSTPSATPICVQTPEVPAETATAQRHVRDLRHDLEAMPQFHPNQLTSARNQSRFASTSPRPNGGWASGSGNAGTDASGSGSGNAAAADGSHSGTLQRSYECLDGVGTLAVMEHMDMRGAAALSPDAGSDHSGGSDETVKIDDVIEYADA